MLAGRRPFPGILPSRCEAQCKRAGTESYTSGQYRTTNDRHSSSESGGEHGQWPVRICTAPELQARSAQLFFGGGDVARTQKYSSYFLICA